MTKYHVEIEKSDALKIYDALQSADVFFRRRDEMNASIHLAFPVRYSPITSKVAAGLDRLFSILYDAGMLESEENSDG